MEAKCDRKMHNFILLRQVEREHRMQHKKTNNKIHQMDKKNWPIFCVVKFNF